MPNRLTSFPSSSINIALAAKPPAEVQSITASAKVARLQERFKAALLNVATQRKEIYEVILDLKEHFHEYGFNNPAAAVEAVCQRSKSWANSFVSEVEAELHIYGKVLKWPENVAAESDTSKKDKEETLNKLSKRRDPLSTNPETDGQYEKPAIHSADEKKRGEVNPRSNGKPISCHHVWRELEELLGKCLNRVDEANRVLPDPVEHRDRICDIKQLMDKIRRWQNRK